MAAPRQTSNPRSTGYSSPRKAEPQRQPGKMAGGAGTGEPPAGAAGVTPEAGAAGTNMAGTGNAAGDNPGTAGAPPVPDAPMLPVGAVVFSELMISRDGPDEGREWIELLNTTAETVDLSGSVLVVDGRDLRLTGTIDANSTLLITQEGAFDEGQLPEGAVLWAELFLPNERGSARLDNAQGVTIDRVRYDAELEWVIASERSLSIRAGSDASMNDLPATWCVTGVTPGAPNADCPENPLRQPKLGDLVITEFLHRPIEGQAEWIEITNVSTSPLLIDDLRVSDASNTNKIDAGDLELPPAKACWWRKPI